MLSTISVLAVASVGAALVTGARVFGLRRIVKHSSKADVAFTTGIAFALAGTLAGMATAIVAGLIMALVLNALKAIYTASDAVSRGLKQVKADRYIDDEHNEHGEWLYNTAPYKD